MLFFMVTPVSGLSKEPNSLPSEKVLRSQVAFPRFAFGSVGDVVAVVVADANSVAVFVTVNVEAIEVEVVSMAVSEGVIGWVAVDNGAVVFKTVGLVVVVAVGMEVSTTAT